ncbi:hypothetical protein HMPREF3191_01064 [Veillonellaceae bacterium DNF00626]|nr:hypothetical protein HMPREF3191_01064 [Veillonellaceae bacterium DNF00626]
MSVCRCKESHGIDFEKRCYDVKPRQSVIGLGVYANELFAFLQIRGVGKYKRIINMVVSFCRRFTCCYKKRGYR